MSKPCPHAHTLNTNLANPQNTKVWVRHVPIVLRVLLRPQGVRLERVRVETSRLLLNAGPGLEDALLSGNFVL